MPAHLELTPAWQDIRTGLRSAVGESVYDIWLSALEVKGWDGSVLVLQGEPGTESWLADRYGRVLEQLRPGRSRATACASPSPASPRPRPTRRSTPAPVAAAAQPG